MEIIREQIVDTHMVVPLIDVNNRPYYLSAATISAGDVKIIRHIAGTWNSSNIIQLPTEVATGAGIYDFSISASELTVDDTNYPVIVKCHKNSAGALWDDQTVIVWLRPQPVDIVQTHLNAITSASIANNFIATGKLAAGVITSTVIASNAIGASQIASNAITSAKLAANSIGASQIASATITSAKFAAGAITSATFAPYAINNNTLSAGTLTNDKFGETLNVNIVSISGSSEAAIKLSKSTITMVIGTITDVNIAPTTTVFDAVDITDASTDHYINRSLIFVTGALKGQAKVISGYSLQSGDGRFTLNSPLTAAPSNTDTFIIV